MTVADVIELAQDTLADPNYERWDEPRLIRLVDMAQKDLCRHAKILKATSILPVYTSNPVITLPDEMVTHVRLSYEGNPLELKSYGEMDQKYPNWETVEGTPVIAVIDKENRNKIRLYPTPTTAYDPDIELSSLYGVITGVNGSTIVTNSNYGTVNEWDTISGYLEVKYITKPVTLTATTDVLEVNSVFESTLKYFVTGRALRDDMDTQNRLVGAEELAFYERELNEAKKESSTNFNSDLGNRKSTYRSPFD